MALRDCGVRDEPGRHPAVNSTSVTAQPRAELARPGSAEEALYWLRDTLGTVAPRDPRTRRLGKRRYRLELLAEPCDRDTFLLVTSWLAEVCR